MVRRIALAAAVLAFPVAALAASQDGSTDHYRAYARANARLASTLPTYPRARLLIAEPIGGEVGDAPFQAIQRIYALPRRTSQQAVNRFYQEKLGEWQRRRRDVLFFSRVSWSRSLR